MGAAVELGGKSFVVVADVTVDTAGAEGVLFKQGGAHGGHVLFIQDGRLHYAYNFFGEREQLISSPDPVPLGRHLFGVRYTRTGTVANSHTPLGQAALYDRRRLSRGAAGDDRAARNLRAGRRHDQRRTQYRVGGVGSLQSPVRLHRRNNRTGNR